MVDRTSLIFRNSLLKTERGRLLPDVSTDAPAISVLFVTEGFLEPSGDLGFQRVVEAVRAQSGLAVTVHFAEFGALRDQPENVQEDRNMDHTGYRYTEFRFDSVIDGELVIDRYDEIWCIGAQPAGPADNNPNAENADNRRVTEHPKTSSAVEISALANWMDAGGGILAMGDHGFIGAAMNWNIPRVGSMRAWLRTDDPNTTVPDRVGIARHDTNRPTAGTNRIATANQSDEVPQAISWANADRRPHPLLSYGDGVVDVFPDHAHEGVVLASVDKTKKCWHDNSKDEFPAMGDLRPGPEVVAYGRVLGEGYDYTDKGPVNAKSFALVSAYDGHAISLGRVVVDSTWHHWMDLNLVNLQEDALAKIYAFYANTTAWLVGRSKQKSLMLAWLTDYVFSAGNMEDVTADGDPADLGRDALVEIGRNVNEGMISSAVESALAQSLSVFKSPELELMSPFTDYARHVFVGCIIQELAAVRDLTLQSDDESMKILSELSQGWGDRALADGVSKATAILRAAAISRRDAFDKLAGAMGGD